MWICTFRADLENYSWVMLTYVWLLSIPRREESAKYNVIPINPLQMESPSDLQTLYVSLQQHYMLMNSNSCVWYCICLSQNPPRRFTGLCWAYSMPPCQYKASVFSPACAPVLLFSIRRFPDALPCKLAFHLAVPDTLTKEINKRVSKSRRWIFSDLSVYSSLAWWSRVMSSLWDINEVMLQFGYIHDGLQAHTRLSGNWHKLKV